ncbi:MAG: two-component system response regulator RppA [Thermoleophilia bacterium]
MRILIVEDEIKLARALKQGLEQENYVVDCIYDGEAGQNRIALSHDRYDLLILDVMLPKISGIDVCAKVRKENVTLPILMLTARDTIDDRVLGLDAGADDYLVKPFDFKELLARIRALLRRPSTSLPPVLKIRDIELDPSTRKASRGGQEIPLTTKEFDMLEYFIRNAGQVLTREQILNSLWDFSFDSFSNVIDVHIKNLRKKIEHGKKENILETIKGMGYRINK